MPHNCPLCGTSCDYETDRENKLLVHVKCESKHSFYMPASLVATIESDLDIKKIRAYNIINEYLLAHNGHAIVDQEPCDFVFYTKDCELPETDESRFVDLENEMLNYPRDFIERIDRALINISRLYPHFGNGFRYNNTLARPLFLELGDHLTFGLHFLADFGYLEFNNSQYSISAVGWKHVAELTKYKVEIDQGFIAMAFKPETSAIREAFTNSIQSCGFVARLMDEKEHNNQIVPEMFYEIKRSKFMVVDITYPNYGAYYEAGYAQALGKEVIICCRNAEFSSVDRNLRPHFDISQKATVTWETLEELKDKLSKRITATVIK